MNTRAYTIWNSFSDGSTKRPTTGCSRGCPMSSPEIWCSGGSQAKLVNRAGMRSPDLLTNSGGNRANRMVSSEQPRRGRGRPSKLTSELQEQILQEIGQHGATYAAACLVAGIGKSTFQTWKAKGLAAKSGQFRYFLHELEKAEARFRQFHLKRIQEAANEASVETRKIVKTIGSGEDQKIFREVVEIQRPPTWTASAWLLERKWPELYSRKHLEVNAKITSDEPPRAEPNTPVAGGAQAARKRSSGTGPGCFHPTYSRTPVGAEMMVSSEQPKRGRGRPSKLTPELQEKILQEIGQHGATYADACLVVGIGRTTFQTWKAKGLAAKSGQFRDFRDELEKAEARFRQFHLRRIQEAANEASVETRKIVKTIGSGEDQKIFREVVEIQRPPTWTASAWLLERKWPELYSRKHLEVNAKITSDEPPPPMRLIIVDPLAKRPETDDVAEEKGSGDEDTRTGPE